MPYMIAVSLEMSDEPKSFANVSFLPETGFSCEKTEDRMWKVYWLSVIYHVFKTRFFANLLFYLDRLFIFENLFWDNGLLISVLLNYDRVFSLEWSPQK